MTESTLNTQPSNRPSNDAATGISRRSWWNRNRLSLLALLVLAPLTPAVIVAKSVSGYRAQNPTAPIVVEVDQTTKYGTATIGPAGVKLTDYANAPPGSRVVRAAIAVSDAGSLTCFSPTLTETTGLHRTFSDSSFVKSNDDNSYPNNCSPAHGTDYVMLMVYVVPSDAVGPFVLDFVADDELPTYVQLKVEPEATTAD